METRATDMSLSAGKPVAVYPKLFAAVLLRSFLPIGFFLVLFWSIAYAMQNNILSTLIIFIGIMAIIFAVWHTKRSKIEYYSDALVICSPFRRDMILLNEIDDLVLEFVAGRRRTSIFLDDDFPRIGYTRYWLVRQNGSTVHFSDEYQAYEELVELLKTIVYKANGPLSHMLAKINDGGKMTFLQFTASREGMTAEDGDFRAWSQLKLINAEFPRRIRLAEGYKKRSTSKPVIWIKLPTRRSLVFEGVIKFFLAPP
ncbi:MAG: hypothetical protein GC179_16080 [Anaerolineaceae bacterium]|nr:hypothetical protein [Anaerolineaceae bacterium]